ncbi:MAG TPA: 3-oxoacyl-ACP reductase FabG [Holophagaceae bacterium]|nr:3-oxoacyl-ACP reductase FabG [Holophagaceae bacterium]
MTDSELPIRPVLVTGATGRLGRAIALRLVQDGFKVTLHCRSRVEEAKALAAGIQQQGGQADWIAFDVTDRGQAQARLEAKVAVDGPFYGVVCNAGIARDGAFPALSGEDWDQVLAVGLDGFFNVVQPLVIPMVKTRKGGRIVTISSVSGVVGNRGQVNYSAAKAGLIGATKALAVELASRGITVNCVAPGLIDSEMVDEAVLERALTTIPMGRVGQADDVAAAVAFLFTDAAGYITRQVIGVNGGMV